MWRVRVRSVGRHVTPPAAELRALLWYCHRQFKVDTVLRRSASTGPSSAVCGHSHFTSPASNLRLCLCLPQYCSLSVPLSVALTVIMLSPCVTRSSLITLYAVLYQTTQQPTANCLKHSKHLRTVKKPGKEVDRVKATFH